MRHSHRVCLAVLGQTDHVSGLSNRDGVLDNHANPATQHFPALMNRRMHVQGRAETCSAQLQFDDQTIAPGLSCTQEDGGSFASNRVVEYITSSEHNHPSRTWKRARISRVN